MEMKKWTAAAMLAGLAVGAMPVGCDQAEKIKEGQAALCCTEFQVGGEITADIGGSAQSQVAVQAVADFAGIASAAVSDITAACRSIAQDLDADVQAQRDAEAQPNKRERMKAWCTLAVSSIGSFKAKVGGTLTINIAPPVCEASVSAKASCQAQCSVEGECNIQANPPTCEGGKLEVSCSGSCTAEVGASVACEGKCEGSCSGSCTAQGGVECAGKCDGICKGAAQGGTGDGIQADGTCQGTCEGTCEVTAPSVTCEGSCNGQCEGSCVASATANVKCDGQCDADYEPLKCSGGELKGGCQVEAQCDANCDASVKAKAECRPPEIVIAFSGSFDAEAAGKLRATLQANLGAVAAFQARLDAMNKIAASFRANVGAVTDIKAACLIPVAAAVAEAVGDLGVSVEASASVVASVK
jgi:hypothetical protein